MSKRIPSEPDTGWPGCMMCHDSGVIWNPLENNWRFCLCPAGLRRKETEPNIVAESNAVVQSLQNKGLM